MELRVVERATGEVVETIPVDAGDVAAVRAGLYEQLNHAEYRIERA